MADQGDTFLNMEGQDRPEEGGSRKTVTGVIADKLIESGAAADIGKSIASNMLDAGKEQAKSVFSTYGSVDVLRPYFDVEPKQIGSRLLQSLRPRMANEQTIPGDMYGPLMLAFTLASILLIGMKTAEHKAEGTLMGKAFGVTFGFWFGSFGMIYFFCFVFNTTVTAAELMSLQGYAMFGFCSILLLDYLTPNQLDFYLAWVVVGALSSLKVALVLKGRTTDRKQGVLVGMISFAINWFYAYYLHFAYAPAHI